MKPEINPSVENFVRQHRCNVLVCLERMCDAGWPPDTSITQVIRFLTKSTNMCTLTPPDPEKFKDPWWPAGDTEYEERSDYGGKADP